MTLRAAAFRIEHREQVQRIAATIDVKLLHAFTFEQPSA